MGPTPKLLALDHLFDLLHFLFVADTPVCYLHPGYSLYDAVDLVLHDLVINVIFNEILDVLECPLDLHRFIDNRRCGPEFPHHHCYLLFAYVLEQ